MTDQLQPGDPAPDFTLESTHGPKSLREHRGEWIVLYFYPKDETPGCTTQACDFRDASEGLGATVLGVSPDGLASHEGFAANHDLAFPLLSDSDLSVARAYGAYGEKNVYGKVTEGLIRSTFIIDPEGTISEAMYNVKPAGHVDRVARRLEELRS